MAGFGDAHRHQHGAIDEWPGFAHALVARIEQHVGCDPQRPRAPRRQPGVEPFCGTADLGGGNRHLRADQPLQDFDHLAGGHALHVHLRERQVQRLLGARAARKPRSDKSLLRESVARPR
jgi:hypothetical protein